MVFVSLGPGSDLCNASIPAREESLKAYCRVAGQLEKIRKLREI